MAYDCKKDLLIDAIHGGFKEDGSKFIFNIVDIVKIKHVKRGD